MRISIRASATRLGGGLRPPSDTSPQESIARAKPALESRPTSRAWYVGFGAVALGSVLATATGVLSAYFGGRLDLLLQRGVDAWMAFPPLLLLMTILSLLGPSVFNITTVLGVAFGIQNSRVIRGVALSSKEHTFVESARALGAGHVRTTLGHILPNALPTIIVLATTGLPTVILTEATLSFVGLGVPPPYPTWGGMLSLAGLDHM